MTESKIQMDQIRSTSATVTDENIRAGSQKKSSLSPAEGLQGASPDATCTCPSGDGYLVHPCPAPVEQAGGDERAAFRPAQVISYRPGMGEVTIYVAGRVPGYMNIGDTVYVSDRAPVEQPSAALAQPSPAQAEVERPEVVGYRVSMPDEPELGHWLEEEAESEPQIQHHAPLMTVAQHERIVGELRAVIAQLRQHKNDYMDSGQETYRALQNEIREREAEIARLDGLVSGRTAERGAALAEVERLRQFERICEGLPQDAIDGGWTVQGIRCYAKRLEDQLKSALARVAELEKQEPVATVAKVPGEDWNGLHFYRDLQGIPSGTKLYTAPVAQAQHSATGKYDDVLLPFLKSMEHELHANAGKGDRPGWLQMDRRTALLEIYYHLAKLQKATKDNDAAGIVEYAADVANMSMMLVDVCGLLAAAPGKEEV
ncbi:TPA: hypothetical protein L4W65_005768 [Pseudomonas aeruginosa]|nr:hypothetical protein [Pseudomonas aeruginosa]